MKKIMISLLLGIAALTLPTGCGKGGGTTTPVNPLAAIPDISNFLVQASTAFVAGAQALIHISSSSLGDGTFKVSYSLTSINGLNSASGLTATLTMSGGTGSFSTPTISSAEPTTVNIIQISNSAGGNATPTSGNISSMFDSTGTMVATYTPNGGLPSPFNATDVTASMAGSMLNIQGIVWEPNLTTINLYEDYYSNATGTVYFFSGVPTGTYSEFNGSAHFGESGSLTIADICSHGQITITTTSPLITGSFTYKNPDSSVVAGTFSCKAP